MSSTQSSSVIKPYRRAVQAIIGPANNLSTVDRPVVILPIILSVPMRLQAMLACTACSIRNRKPVMAVMAFDMSSRCDSP